MSIPDGFQPLPAMSGFIAHNGPIFVKREEGGVAFGLQVGAHHCNPMGICHGGWLSTMADMLLPLTARLTIDDLNGHFLLTVNLTQDFLGPAPLGCWLEGRAQVLRRTKRMVFVQGLLTTGDAPVLRASGVFRIGGPVEPLTV